jgi:hypothetical protein
MGVIWQPRNFTTMAPCTLVNTLVNTLFGNGLDNFVVRVLIILVAIWPQRASKKITEHSVKHSGQCMNNPWAQSMVLYYVMHSRGARSFTSSINFILRTELTSAADVVIRKTTSAIIVQNQK